MNDTLRQSNAPVYETRWILVITAVSCAMLELIDATIVNVALREISGSIGATRTEIAWVVTAYSIANVIVIPLSGMLSNLIGRKFYFTGSVILFTFASLMCGMSVSLWSLVIWRFIQGLGGGGLLSTGQSIIVGEFPPEKINTANTIFGLGIILGPVIGPVLGGFIVDSLSWHWIFFVNIPVGALAAVLSWLYVNNLEGLVKPRKIDWWGILFIAIAISTLQYILEEGGEKYWFESTEITILSIISFIAIIAFIIRELSIDYPAVNIRLLANYNLAMGNGMSLITGAITMGSMFIFPLFVQTTLGWTALQTGVFLLYKALATAVGMVLVGRALSKGANPKVVMLSGLTMIVIFLTILSFSSPDSNKAHFIIPFIIGGLGNAFLMMPVISLALGELRGSDLAQGTGLSNMMKRFGGAIGVAFINIFLNHQNAIARGNMANYVNAYNPLSVEKIAGYKQAFIAAGYAPDEAKSAAYQAMSQLITKQQLLVSYDHGFLMVGVVVLLCIPVILLIRNKKTELKGVAH